ncbi:MAG TPA: hypothetical protein VG125_10530 [Pirellulales bacterium]|jgi:hypothetical protein|nr:hypothetical protein [Pirellulales bacterium]
MQLLAKFADGQVQWLRERCDTLEQVICDDAWHDPEEADDGEAWKRN